MQRMVSLFCSVQAALECAVVRMAHRSRQRAWAAWMEVVGERRRMHGVAVLAAEGRKAKLLEACFDSWCMCEAASLLLCQLSSSAECMNVEQHGAENSECL